MRYLVEKNGLYYFQASPAMRKNGFSTESFGSDLDKAEARVLELTEQWESIRATKRQGNRRPQAGIFSQLIDVFQKDYDWYGKKHPRTREEYDYSFQIISKYFGDAPVKSFQRRHGRAFYNELRNIGASAHKAKRVMKSLRRLMKYAIELGIRLDNPVAEMSLETPKARDQVWTSEEIQAVIEEAQKGGKATSGNVIPSRPSIALAVSIAYDTSLPQQDILALTWDQFDGEGLNVNQKKKRGGKEIWVPLSPQTIKILNSQEKQSTYIIVSEVDGKPYIDLNVEVNRVRCRSFSRIFRKFRKRAGIERHITFHDIRRTALTEYGNSGATTAEIVSLSGHQMNSRILDVYVKPDRKAGQNAAKKRGFKKSS
ncbi:MAG: tyrosine-type recombinase/integrase [Magnetococcales bacterium]|nr:tyrosine-type recombinase/integrase [Magnetococcales bacterium]